MRRSRLVWTPRKQVLTDKQDRFTTATATTESLKLRSGPAHVSRDRVLHLPMHCSSQNTWVWHMVFFLLLLRNVIGDWGLGRARVGTVPVADHLECRRRPSHRAMLIRSGLHKKIKATTKQHQADGFRSLNTPGEWKEETHGLRKGRVETHHAREIFDAGLTSSMHGRRCAELESEARIKARGIRPKHRWAGIWAL